MVDYRDLTEVAVRGAQAGAEVLRRYFRDKDLETQFKSEHDLVSRADHESEERILEVIHGRFPDHRILAEEGGAQSRGLSEFEWIIDPLDGTANFLQGLPMFCVSIACRYRDDVVAGAIYDPLGDQMFTATKGVGAFRNGEPIRISSRPSLEGAFLATGYPFRARRALDLYLQAFRAIFLRSRAIRRCGSAALDLAYTASGVYDGFFEFRLSPWDIAAGCLMVVEAGGVITDLDGQDGYLHSGNLVAGPAGLHSELRSLVSQYVDEATLEALEPSRNKLGLEVVE